MIVETDSKGIPLKHVGYPDSMSVATFYVVGNVVMGGIGLAMAWFLAYNPTEAKRAIVDAKIGILAKHNTQQGLSALGICSRFMIKSLA